MKPISLADKQFWKNIPESGGVYHIRCFKDNKVIKINRVLGIDNDGILYIGKSDNLRERLRMLWRVINPKLKATAHTFGTKYNDNKNLRFAFPLKTLFVSIEVAEEPKKLENELLDKYFIKFGEVPPFNSTK
jgi:hypothetical protein